MNYVNIPGLICQSLVFIITYCSTFLVLGQTSLQESISAKRYDATNSGGQEHTSQQTTSYDYSVTATSKQIPLCMIGDSITWAGDGDCWRKELLKRMPNLAFIGTHSAVAGYSHAGEGGNNTAQVLDRIGQIPDCPYYHLLIGTNNNGVKNEAEVEPKAVETSKDVIEIIHALLDKKSVEKVFLASLFPCHTDNPLRDYCNSATNKVLRAKFAQVFPDDKVVWVEYENPLRKIAGWKEKIRLHPTPEGYNLIADITAKSIASTLHVEQGQTPVKPANSGVRVVNLMKENRTTSCPMIAGWYTLSFRVTDISGENPKVSLQGVNSNMPFPFQLTLPIQPGQRVSKNFFTQYERYKYARDFLKLTTVDCTISEVLLEKSRPSMQPSVYGVGSFIDTQSPTRLGELLEQEN